MYICICMCICMCIYLYICMYIYIYTYHISYISKSWGYLKSSKSEPLLGLLQHQLGYIIASASRGGKWRQVMEGSIAGKHRPL